VHEKKSTVAPAESAAPSYSAGQILIRMPRVQQKTGLGTTKIYELMQERSGAFPRPIKIGVASLWVEAEVEAWIADQIAARDAT